MKVSGPGSTKNTSKTDKSKKSGSSDGSSAFGALISSGSSGGDGVSGVGASGAIAHMDALLMAQAAEDPTQGRSRQRMQKRANKILDVLDELRLKMLGGRLTVGDMIDMADVVASHREKVDDPTLTALMDEVDLRAQVELAKMRAGLARKA